MIPAEPEAPAPRTRRRVGLAAPRRDDEDERIPLAPAPMQLGFFEPPPRAPDRTDH